MVTGLGIITHAGVDAQFSRKGMLSGASAVKLDDDHQPTRAALGPRGERAGHFDHDGVEGFPSSRTVPCVQCAIIAADLALRDAGLGSALTTAQMLHSFFRGWSKVNTFKTLLTEMEVCEPVITTDPSWRLLMFHLSPPL